MSTVDQGYAAWLKSERSSVTAQTPDAARWAAQGRAVEIASAFGTAAGAEAEAARQAELLGRPFVRDRVVVAGERRDLWGRTIRLLADRLDYGDEGEVAIVIGFAEQENGTTILTVLRRLA